MFAICNLYSLDGLLVLNDTQRNVCHAYCNSYIAQKLSGALGPCFTLCEGQVQRPYHIACTLTHKVVNACALTHNESLTVARKEMEAVECSAGRNTFTDINSWGGEGQRLIHA